MFDPEGMLLRMDREERNLPSEGSGGRRTDEGARGDPVGEAEERRTPEEVGLTGEGSDWETTAREVREQGTDAEVRQEESSEPEGERREAPEDKGILERIKDKLKGE